jgi:hypothetical protein
MKNDKKNIITEISRIQEIMYGKSIISEGRITRFADDLADFIKSFKSTSKYINGTPEVVSYVDELLKLATSNDINKEQKIIDLLKAERTNSQLSTIVADYEDKLYKIMHENEPTLKEIRTEVETFKSEKNADGTSKYPDEKLNEFIDTRTAGIKDDVGVDLFIKKLKEEFNIKVETPTVSTSTTRKLSDDELLINTKREISTDAASLENNINSFEGDLPKLEGDALDERVNELITNSANLLKKIDVVVSKRTGIKKLFKTNQDYTIFVTEFKKALNEAFKATDLSIDSMPQKYFDDWVNLSTEDQLKVLTKAKNSAKLRTPTSRGKSVIDAIFAVYDVTSLNILFKKLPGGKASAEGFGPAAKAFFKRLGYKMAAGVLVDILWNVMNTATKRIEDEDLIDTSLSGLLGFDDSNAETWTPAWVGQKLGGMLVNSATFGWTLTSLLISVADWGNTDSEPGLNGTNKNNKTFDDLGMSASDAESIQALENFINIITQNTNIQSGDTVTYDFGFFNYLIGGLRDGKIDYTDMIYGLPTSGINQIRVDANKEFWYIADNGMFKIEGVTVPEGQVANPYIEVKDSEGNESMITIKEIFLDKYNRFLPDYYPVTEQPKSGASLRFWPMEVKWDNKWDKTKNAELSKLVGVWNPNLIGIVSPITNFLKADGITLPSKYLQPYGYYKEEDITRNEDGTIDVKQGTDVDKFTYLVEDGNAYRIHKADKDYFTIIDSDGDSIKKDVYYVVPSGGNGQWAKLTTKAKEILSKADDKTTTSTNENLSPKEQFEKDNPNTKLTLIASIGDLAVYKGSDNKRYKLLEGKIVDINSQK